ncbi:hypothetical protein Golob_004588 [Gossypium lobatum]|uniref:DUF538 domain-containing protein n=1 Tax=Gossypium lobatum TaxID=34289 RepID=A0A7J8N2E7_9ROSI|nr:hypothetical protein [Gossypium lobatum]
MSRVTKEIKAKAEVYYGDETCREKFVSLLEEKGFPIGLLTFQDIQECGYVKDTGFVGLRHKKKRELCKLEDVVLSYDAEITAYFEPKKIKNLTGVKAKEFLIWITLTDIYVDQSSSITFKTNLVGLSKSFPVSVFNV